MGEYGNPDVPEDWAYIRTFSPYHNVEKSVKYPRTLFTTSTRDDRVHPGHARKMVAKMNEQGHDVLYYENIEGGHGAAADNKQAAFMEAIGVYVSLEGVEEEVTTGRPPARVQGHDGRISRGSRVHPRRRVRRLRPRGRTRSCWTLCGGRESCEDW